MVLNPLKASDNILKPINRKSREEGNQITHRPLSHKSIKLKTEIHWSRDFPDKMKKLVSNLRRLRAPRTSMYEPKIAKNEGFL